MKHTRNRLPLWPQILLLIAIIIVVIVLFAGRFVVNKMPEYWADKSPTITEQMMFDSVANGELKRTDNRD